MSHRVLAVQCNKNIFYFYESCETASFHYWTISFLKVRSMWDCKSRASYPQSTKHTYFHILKPGIGTYSLIGMFCFNPICWTFSPESNIIFQINVYSLFHTLVMYTQPLYFFFYMANSSSPSKNYYCIFPEFFFSIAKAKFPSFFNSLK